MSQSGYDRRTRNTDRVAYVSAKSSSSPGYTGTIHLKSEEVISFRDNVEGQPLLDITVDPYMGYLASTNETKYKEQRRVQLELERAGLPGLPDYEVKEFVDTGHVFDKKTDWVNTSLRASRPYVSYPGQGSYEGFPFYAVGASVNSQYRSLMPFKMNTTSSYTENAFFPGNAYRIPFPPEGELESYGKKALSIVAPGRPKVDLFRAIGELLAGIPQMPGKALLTKQDIFSTGDEWLNMLFGIMPTREDAIDIGNVLKDISGALLQYRRDAGRIVRRKMVFPEIVRSAIFTDNQLDPNTGKIYAGAGNYGFNRSRFTGSGSSSNEQVRRDLPTTSEIFMRELRTISFAGAFTYYIPTSPDFAGKVGRYVTELDRVIGLSANPTNVWELTPWSWLSDWFIDIKSQLDLADVAFDDNLVINYGYAMEHSTRSVVCKTTLASPTPLSGISFASTYLSSERKRRIRANPYGFVSSTTSQGWNPFRWSILAALGISRLR